MEPKDFTGLSGDGYDKVIEKVKDASPQPKKVPTETLLQLDPKEHDVMKPGKRKDKIKKVEEEDGTKTQTIVPVARLPIALQKLIVRRAAAFLCGNPITLVAQPDGDDQSDFLELLKKVWDDNKLDYESLELAKKMMGETQCAELWYYVPAEPGYWGEGPNNKAKNKMRVKVLAPSLGDLLYPVYDTTGDMIAFGRGFNIKVDQKDEEHFDLYTAERIYYGKKGPTNWEVKAEPNLFKKIPVIYWTQGVPEWYDVEELIGGLETVVSNTRDTNAYFASPMVVLSGQVSGLGDKEDQGKVIQTENGGEAKYLTWDNAPEATKFEYQNLKSLIFEMTDTPDISFEAMKGVNTFSGIALKMLFLGAHLKAAEKEGTFGKGVQRRINFLKAGLVTINGNLEKASSMTIKPKFEYYLPKNDQEAIEVLTTAVGSGKAIMSQEAAVRQNPLVGDAEAELEQMKEEGSLGSDIEAS
ncbi:phage portal protein [Chitinophaga niabensis]|uniref:phage portal protein n=1 Tax=Chitinophaga niabensis TaxID=536979 RepID=UPI0031BAF957